jgi:tRNA A-37 threonylcarbamoyl transferase component Bud32/dipeptidyl aminopeptidase/acylaminoacyl peptidase
MGYPCSLMTLPAGTKLGPYEILSKLGEGGMGDVYKARDTRLERSVAIKVVRTDFSERFQREAQSISALNHPNICTLHDVGEQNGTAYLVMEFVDGAPIAGPLPVADVIKYGMQIANALDAAHRAGIVHRDLKPANVMATKSGIKLLDFGLAKLQPKTTRDQIGNEATVAALTGAHTVIGTPQYMAPEQIEGRDADARTDIFALGCVLYELVTGKRAFEGKTASSVMAAVLATEPRRISDLVPLTPPPLEMIVARCLEKDPDARWQSARDVALQLKWLIDHPADAAVAAPKPPSYRSLAAGLAIGALVAAAAVVALMTWGGRRTETAGDVTSLGITLPPGLAVVDGSGNPSIALSPDGRLIAIAGYTKDSNAIYLRRLDSFDAIKVAGTEDGSGPFFSPHGDWLGFWVNGQIKKVPIGGGAPVLVAEAPALRSAVWLDDDTIVYSPQPTSGLMSVSANGGPSKTLTTLDSAQQEKTHRGLIGLPGGKAVVFTVGSNEIGTYDEARIVALTLATGKITEILKGGYSPVFASTGHLLYVNQHRVFAVPFDIETLKATGSPVQVIEDVASQADYAMANLGLSATGTVAYATGGDRSRLIALRWMDRKGNFEAIPAEDRTYGDVAISPDGRKVALTVSHANNVLFSYDVATNHFTRVTLRLDVESPAWASDDKITYWSGSDVRTIAADGSTKEEILLSAAVVAGRTLLPLNWSRDGQKLALLVEASGQRPDIAVYLKAENKLVPVAQTRFDEVSGRLSPDGRWLVYMSDESGRPEVIVRASDGTGPKYPVTNGGGFQPMWAKDGRELIYGTPKALMAASFTAAPTPTIGPPEILFSGDKPEFDNIRNVDVLPDGRRFVALVMKPPPTITEIKVVTNWTDRLKQLLK